VTKKGTIVHRNEQGKEQKGEKERTIVHEKRQRVGKQEGRRSHGSQERRDQAKHQQSFRVCHTFSLFF
jgi:hypothetical protein